MWRVSPTPENKILRLHVTILLIYLLAGRTIADAGEIKYGSYSLFSPSGRTVIRLVCAGDTFREGPASRSLADKIIALKAVISSALKDVQAGCAIHLGGAFPMFGDLSRFHKCEPDLRALAIMGFEFMACAPSDLVFLKKLSGNTGKDVSACLKVIGSDLFTCYSKRTLFEPVHGTELGGIRFNFFSVWGNLREYPEIYGEGLEVRESSRSLSRFIAALKDSRSSVTAVCSRGGYEFDTGLAEKVPEINLIVGPGSPTRVIKFNGTFIVYVEAGCPVCIDLVFEEGFLKDVFLSNISCRDTWKEEKALRQLYDFYDKTYSAAASRTFRVLETYSGGDGSLIGVSELGRLVTESMAAGTGADISVYPVGMLRGRKIAGGGITRAGILELFSDYSNCVVIEADGGTIFSVLSGELLMKETDRYIYVSGLPLEYLSEKKFYRLAMTRWHYEFISTLRGYHFGRIIKVFAPPATLFIETLENRQIRGVSSCAH